MSANKIFDTAGKVTTLIVVLALLLFFLSDVVKVDERQVAIITRMGRFTDSRTAGWSLKIPVIENVAAIYRTDIQSISDTAASATKDQQSVNLKVNTQYRIDVTKMQEIFRQFKDQDTLNKTIVPPLIQEAVKASTTQFSAAELLEKRDMLKTKIEEALSKRFDEYNLKVVAVNVENIDFSEQFDKAIEQKVIAEQEVEKKKQELEKEKLQSQIELTKAQAEAEAVKVKGQAIKDNPGVLELEKIKKWDGKLPQVQGSAQPIIDLTPKN
jgi:regulator of protease activity HflC (stomatin/prohibitin superfamily)